MPAKRIPVNRVGKGMTLLHLGVEYPVKGVSRTGDLYTVDIETKDHGIVPVDLHSVDYVWVVEKTQNSLLEAMQASGHLQIIPVQ